MGRESFGDSRHQKLRGVSGPDTQVVNFEAKMLLFSLNELVLVHKDWAQSNQLVQDQFELHQDRIAATEETLRSLKTKVRASSSEVVLTFTEGLLIGFRSREGSGLRQLVGEGC